MPIPTSNLSSNPFVDRLEGAYSKSNAQPAYTPTTPTTSNGTYGVLTSASTSRPNVLSPDGTTVFDSLGRPYQSPATEAYNQSLAKQSSANPTSPTAPTTGVKSSPIAAKPTSSATASATGLVVGLAGGYLGEKAGRALGGDLGAGYGEALGSGLAVAAATAQATGNPMAAAVAGGLTAAGSLTLSALSALASAISAGKGLEQAKANLAKSNDRYEQAKAVRALSPFPPTLGRNANTRTRRELIGYTPIISYTQLPSGIRTAEFNGGGLPAGSSPSWSVDSTSDPAAFRLVSGGAIFFSINKTFAQEGSFSVTMRAEYGDVEANPDPPFVPSAYPATPFPQAGSLPWLPSVDLRGSPADRAAFPEAFKSPEAKPIPSPSPATSPNISPSKSPTGALSPSPSPSPTGAPSRAASSNSSPVNGANPSPSAIGNKNTFSIPTVDPSTALVLGALAAGTATTVGLLNQVNNQTKPEAQQTNAKQGVCDAMQPSQCGFEGVKQATAEATQPIKDQTVANGGALAGLLNLLTTVWEFLQNRLGKILNILNNTVVDRTLAVMNLATNIHNAAMLTRDIGETLGSVVDNVVGLTGLRFTNSEGAQLPFTDFIGSNFRTFLISVLGVENYTSLVLNWQKANTIYHSAMAVVNTTQSMLDPISSAVEYGMENVSKIGNSLKEDGVVSENAYPAMDETIRARRVNRFERLNDTLEGAENIASNLSSVTSSAVSVKEDYKQLREDSKDLKDKASAFNTADSEARAALKAELPTEITPITLAPAPAEDEE